MCCRIPFPVVEAGKTISVLATPVISRLFAKNKSFTCIKTGGEGGMIQNQQKAPIEYLYFLIHRRSIRIIRTRNIFVSRTFDCKSASPSATTDFTCRENCLVMASGGTSIISEVLRRGSVPKYYCHGCKSRFGTNRQTTTSVSYESSG